MTGPVHNAHTRRRELAPANEPASFLPIDTPPITSRLPAALLRGLIWEFDAGTSVTPVPRPWTPYSSQVFPESHPSNVGPAAIRPRYGYSINDYSPVPHRLGGVLMEQRPPPPAVRPNFAGHGRRKLGRSSGRIRAAVTPYPQANPQWQSMFANALLSGGQS